jgi:hypothetical protein
MPRLRQILAAPPRPQAGVVSRVPAPKSLGLRGRQNSSSARWEEARLYVVKLLLGDAVDATENLLIYLTKSAILETNENESLRAGQISSLQICL